MGKCTTSRPPLAGGDRRNAPWAKLSARSVAGHELESVALSEPIHRPVRVAIEMAVVLLYSLVASGHIRLRRTDGWQKIATVLRQQTPRVA